MKMTSKNTSQTTEQPVFHKVAENLYRLESSSGYYALLKRGGKQFRRSLKTKDRKLADRRLNDLRAKIGCLKISTDVKLNFEQRQGREKSSGPRPRRFARSRAGGSADTAEFRTKGQVAGICRIAGRPGNTHQPGFL